MKKKLALALAAIIAVCALSGCSQQEPTHRDRDDEETEEQERERDDKDTEENGGVNDLTTSMIEQSETDSVEPETLDIEKPDFIDNQQESAIGSEIVEAHFHAPTLDIFNVLPAIDETPASKFEYEYDVELEGMRITKYTGQSPKIRVPASLEGEPVVEVWLDGFEEQVTHLYLPDSVQYVIEKREKNSREEKIKYASLTNLKYTNIPDSINWEYSHIIDSYNLEAVYIDNGVTEIGEYAFSECEKLTEIIIPYNVTTIQEGAFYGCSALSSINLPEGITRIGDAAFSGCCNLISVTIPNGVTEIGEYAFRNCSGLTSITIPDSVTEIGYYAFGYCTGLTSIAIPNSVTKIGDLAFCKCSGLTSITIPDSVTEIGDDAFEGCSIIVTYKGNTYDRIDDLYAAINGN